MTIETIEQRLEKVEHEVRQLRALVGSRSPKSDWLERLTGSMKDEPAFDEVLLYGWEHRVSDKPDEDSSL